MIIARERTVTDSRVEAARGRLERVKTDRRVQQ